MNPQRILFAAARAYPDMGGIETHIYEVSRRLAERGYDITVLTTDRQGDRATEETLHGVKFFRVPAYPAQADLYYAPAIRNHIQQHRYDILHVQGYHTFVPPLAMSAARQVNLPYVLTFHSGGHTSSWRNLIRPLQAKLQHSYYASARKLIGVSHFEAEEFRQWLGLPAEQFTVVPNGSTLPQLPADTPPRNPHSRLILSVGRLEKYKGHHRLIAAMPAVLQQCPAAKLKVLGVGPYEAPLKQLVRKMHLENVVEVTYIPPGNRSSMAQELHAARLIASMSEYEAHPIAIIEAAALNCSILVADTSGLGELAQQDIARALPLESTTEEIAAALVQQLETPFTPSQFKLHTWDDCTAALLQLYSQVLQRS